MVYMPNVDKILLYGGFMGVSGTTGADAWEYTPSTNTWAQICSNCGPGARHAHGMVYDNASGKVIIFRGQRSLGGPSIQATHPYDPAAPPAPPFATQNHPLQPPA